MRLTTYYPQTTRRPFAERDEACERALTATLEEHFGAYAVPMSCGRAALRACLRILNVGLHTHSIAVPPFLSRCVLDALMDYAFPMRSDSADIRLLYNQYGLSPEAAPRGGAGCIDDRAHCFFHPRPVTGLTVVSFSKFFDTGCGGALLTPSAHERDEAARLVAATEVLSPAEETFVQGTFYANLTDPEFAIRSGRAIDTAAVLLKHSWRPLGSSLAAMPTTREGFLRVRDQRLERLERLCRGLRSARTNLDAAARGELPFFLPFYPEDETSLEPVADELRASGICCSTYSINQNPPGLKPLFRRAVALPCHQNIGDEVLDAMNRVLGRHGAK
jgi:hypothetical protein